MARFWVGGGSSANWSATSPTNWSATSGGSNNATVPGASDDVTFDGAGASGNTASTVSATITVLSLTFTSGYTNTVTLNAVPTIAGNFTDHTAHSWAGSSGITISAASTITSGGKTFPNAVTFSGANTKTLAANWQVNGLFSVTGNTIVNGFILSLNGGMTSNTSTLGGTTVITFIGTGTINGGAGASTAISSPITFNTAGTITLSTNIVIGSGAVITYTAGTVNASSNTLTIIASCTMNTAGMTWGSITHSGSSHTLTINSQLTMSGTLTILTALAITYAGTAGWQCANFTLTTFDNRTMTFVNGVTYTITSAFNCSASRTGAIVLFTSVHATNKANLTLTNGASCNVLASFTRIDASGGRTIWTFNGTITTCININSFTDLKTVAAAS